MSIGSALMFEEARLGDDKSASPDAVLFVLSVPNISNRRLAEMERQFTSACELPSRLLRLENSSDGLPTVLDAFRTAGHRTILVQPIGLPFPEGLLAWLPGVLSHWQQADGNEAVEVLLGREVSVSSTVVAQIAQEAVSRVGDAIPARRVKPSLGKRGWQDPPDFTHHLLVCTGPRCQFRDAASLVQTLKEETARQGVGDQCLTSRTGCLFPCNRGPLVALYPRGEWYRLPDTESVQRFVATVLVSGESAPELLFHRARAARLEEAAE